MLPKVDQCCSGCSLKRGAILIAAYHIVISLCALLLATLVLARVSKEHSLKVEGMDNKESAVSGTGNNSKRHLLVNIAGGKALTLMISSIITLVLNMMLLVGIVKEELCLIYTWISTHGICLMIAVVSLLIQIFMIGLSPEGRTSTVGSSLLGIVLMFYFLIVVNSYREQLKNRPTTTIPPTLSVVICDDNQSPPPPYSEVYPNLPQQK